MRRRDVGLAFGFVLLGSGCVREVRLGERTSTIPGERFTGPFTLPVPRRAEHAGHDLVMEVALTARCRPRVEAMFPDGEVEVLAPWSERDGQSEWQALLARRAEATPPPRNDAPAPRPPEPLSPYDAPAPAPVAPIYGAPASMPPVTYHAEVVLTETWPGQRRFLALRDERCAEEDTFRVRRLVAYEEREGVTLFAKVPQEMRDARVAVTVWEVVPPPRRPDPPPPPAAAVAVEAKARIQVRPPMPPPKKEKPGKPAAAGATFQPGRWIWQEGSGQWEWIEGYWLPPSTVPAVPVEQRAAAPARNAVWVSGYWAWRQGDGQWVWIAGSWTTPPRPVEKPGDLPAAGATWMPGRFTIEADLYVWIEGRWILPSVPPKPAPRVEQPGPPPWPGARWIAGDWFLRGTTWTWIPGWWSREGNPPPPLRAEAPPPSPEPGAVWLHGYWRWDDAGAQYAWVDGHWERPPGAGYVWVPDPPPPSGIPGPPTGRWEIRVRINLPVPHGAGAP